MRGSFLNVSGDKTVTHLFLDLEHTYIPHTYYY